jgi:hypothetical protein
MRCLAGKAGSAEQLRLVSEARTVTFGTAPIKEPAVGRLFNSRLALRATGALVPIKWLV